MSALRRTGSGRPATDGALRIRPDDLDGRLRVPPLGGLWPTEWPPFLWAQVDEPPFVDPDGFPNDSIAGLYGLARTDPLEWASGRSPIPLRPYRSVVWAGEQVSRHGSRRVCYVPPGFDPAPFATKGEPDSAGPQHYRGRLTLAVHPLSVVDPNDFETLESPGPGWARLLLENSGYGLIAWEGRTRFWQAGGETFGPLTSVRPQGTVQVRAAGRTPPGLPRFAGELGTFGLPEPEEPPIRRGG